MASPSYNCPGWLGIINKVTLLTSGNTLTFRVYLQICRMNTTVWSELSLSWWYWTNWQCYCYSWIISYVGSRATACVMNSAVIPLWRQTTEELRESKVLCFFRRTIFHSFAFIFIQRVYIEHTNRIARTVMPVEMPKHTGKHRNIFEGQNGAMMIWGLMSSDVEADIFGTNYKMRLMMMWGLLFSGVGVTYLEEEEKRKKKKKKTKKKEETDDDVGLNVLRCRADTFGTNNKMRFWWCGA